MTEVCLDRVVELARFDMKKSDFLVVDAQKAVVVLRVGKHVQLIELFVYGFSLILNLDPTFLDDIHPSRVNCSRNELNDISRAQGFDPESTTRSIAKVPSRIELKEFPICQAIVKDGDGA